MSASNPLTKILDIHRLTGPNFKDWLRNYKIILGSKKLTHVLDQDPPAIQHVRLLNREHLWKSGQMMITKPGTTCWVQCLMIYSANMKIF